MFGSAASLRSCFISAACALSLSAFASEERPRDITVVPGELAGALESLAKQFGVDIIYSNAQLRGLKTQGVSGVLDHRTALHRLVAGTSLVVKEFRGAILVTLPETVSSDAASFERTNLIYQVEEASDTTSAGSVTQLVGLVEEVTVTARRREENLMETPIAITAISGGELILRQVDRTSQLAETTPNMVFQTSRNSMSTAAMVYIRGIGQNDFLPTLQAGVGTYVDGVYISSISGSLSDTTDIASIEVLRGPQGTLFGRNTIGGAILINSVKPTGVFSGKADVIIGDYGRREFKGSINVPLTDNLFGRLSILSREVDGYVETPNTPNDDGLGSDETQAARLALRWQPNSALTLDLAADVTRREAGGPPQVLLSLSPPGTPGKELTTWNSVIAPALGMPQMSSEYLVQLGEYRNLGFIAQQGRADIWGASLTAEWDLGAVTLKSITGYRDQKTLAAFDGDHTPLPVSQRQNSIEGDQFTQEVQLLGTAFNDRLSYVAGLYYFKEEMVDRNPTQFPNFLIMSGAKVDNKSSAAFSQVTYDLTDRWSVTTGYRYSEDRLDSIVDDDIQYVIRLFNAATGVFDSLPAPPALGSRRITAPGVKSSDYSGGVPYANLSHQWDTLMAYASYSEGYKGGGFSQRIQPGGVVVPFGPEEASVYELGFKWDGLDQRLRLNGALFYTDYQKIQVSVLSCAVCVGTAIQNAGDAEIKGGELELQAVVTSQLRITAGLGYLESEYKRLDPAVTFPRSNKLPSTPEWQYNSSVTYRWPLVGFGGELIARVDYSHNDSYTFDADNSSNVKAIDLFNAGVTYIPASESWEIAVQARNVTDEYYWVGGAGFNATASSTGWGTYTLGPPRMISARLTHRF